MLVKPEELIPALAQFNPWWRGEEFATLPHFHRGIFRQFERWLLHPPVHRAILLSGARQIGKTTLMLQAVKVLLAKGVPAGNILYATFDHPMMKLAGVDAVITAWRLRVPKAAGPEYLFLDEAQFIPDWGTWVKHQIDFNKERRIAFTGSAMPLTTTEQESGVGRWHTLRMTTLSFYEYVHLRQLDLPRLPLIESLHALFAWSPHEFYSAQELACNYIGHFHEYLLRGGFPQTAKMDDIVEVQRLMREDIIDKVLKRDMTAIFNVRRILDLEHCFLYLCLHDGGMLDMVQLCANLEVKRPTAQHYIALLEATHLIYRLPPHGYGKDILRGRFKIYLADPAMAPAVMLRGRELLEDAKALSIATEAAVFKHLFTRHYPQNVRISYWQNARKQEVDLIAEMAGEVIPFEIKYRSGQTEAKDIKGLIDFCLSKAISKAYVVTKSLEDFGPMQHLPQGLEVMRIPATMMCYWLGD